MMEADGYEEDYLMADRIDQDHLDPDDFNPGPNASCTVPLDSHFFRRLVRERPDIALCRASSAVSRAAEEEADRHGLWVNQHVILKMLDAVGCRSQQSMAEELRIDRTCMVTCIDRLEQSGLVRRDRNPADRRAYAVGITEAGREMLARLDSESAETMERIFAPLSAEERQILAQLLDKLLKE